MQVRVPFLVALATLASIPALAQPMASAQTGGDCFRRVPADPASVWVAAPCQGQVSPDAFPDGLAGGPPTRVSLPPPPPYAAPSLTYQAGASADYAQAQPPLYGAPPPGPFYPAPTYPGPTYSSAGYGSPDAWPQADPAAPAYGPEPPPPAYDPNRTPFYAGNIVSAPSPLPPPAAPPAQVYSLPPAADSPPAFSPPIPAYGPPPAPNYGYGPDDCALTSGPLDGGGFWQRQDCRAAAAAPAAYAANPYPAQAYAPMPPPRSDYLDGDAYGASRVYSQQQAGGYQVSNGGYAYGGPTPAALPGYAPGQCASSAGLIGGGRGSYQAQTCERSSSQSYSYAGGSGGYYAGGDGFQGDGPHWRVAGRDPNGFLTWPGKVGY